MSSRFIRKDYLSRDGAMNVAISRVANLFIGLFFITVLTRSLDTQALAQVLLCISAMALLRSLMVFGADIMIVRYGAPLSQSKCHDGLVALLRRLAVIVVSSSIVTALLGYFVLTSRFVSFGDDISSLVIFATICCVAIHCNAEMFRAMGDLRLASVYSGSLGGPVATLLSAMFLSLTQQAGSSLLVMQTLSVMVFVVFGAGTLQLIHHMSRKTNESNDAELVLPSQYQILRESSHCVAAQLFGEARTIGSLWIVHWQADAAAVACFGLAQRLINPLSLLLSICETIAAPKIAMAHALDKLAGYQKTLQRYAFIASLPLLLLLSAILLLGDSPIRYVTKSLPPNFSTIFTLLLIGQLLFTLGGASTTALNMVGESRKVARLAVALFVVQTVAGTIATGIWGGLGMATVVMSIQCVSKIFTNQFLHRKTGIYVFAQPPQLAAVYQRLGVRL